MPRSRITSGKLSAQTLTNGLIASARNLKVSAGAPPRRIPRQEWQESAWYWYDAIEVYHYGVQWIGNTLSRAKLVVLENGKPTTNQKALDALESFFGGAENHGEFLRQAAIQITVAGEGYIVGQAGDGDHDEWLVAAAVEMKVGPSGYKLENEEINPATSFVIRFWRPHPRKPSQGDSPTRPLLPVLSQLDELTKYVSAQLDSRLSGNGILKIPTEITFPTPAAGADGTQQTGLNAFVQDMAEHMAVAKRDRGDAAARVPYIIQADGEFLDKIDWLTLWSELDEAAPALRTEIINRIALGMDMPPEALTGTGDMNHWGAWHIDDSLIKSHAEPLLKLLTRSLTDEYLRVVLIEDGMSEEDARAFTVDSDDADMRLRPDRSQQALEMWDRGELSGVALRREVGFLETDKMTDEEKKTWLLYKLAQGSPDTTLVAKAVEELTGLKVDASEVPTGEPAGGERPLPRSLENHPKRELPDTKDVAEAAALLATSEAVVFRALERVGNRMKTVRPVVEGLPKDVDAIELYKFAVLSKGQLDHVLSGAWSQLSRFNLGSFNAASLETHLDNFVRMLVTSRKDYDRDLLKTYLNLVRRDK